MIYLSKFMQIVQKKVILNDIKYNDDEKMFCLISCIEIECNIKLKDEYLKDFSRFLIFMKSDINYYLLHYIQFVNKNKIYKDIYDSLNLNIKNYENKIRKNLIKFYFDFDFHNYKIINLIIKYGFNFSNGNDDIQMILNQFISKYSKKFSLCEGKDVEKIFIYFFNRENILYGKENISFFKFPSNNHQIL